MTQIDRAISILQPAKGLRKQRLCHGRFFFNIETSVIPNGSYRVVPSAPVPDHVETAAK